MSFVDKVKKINIKKIKKTTSIASELKLRSLNENIFPYACLLADDVMLTKNGEVLQMIEILLDDFKLNQEGGLRDAIRTAIADNTNDLKTAFWVQTVKRKKTRSKSIHSVIKHDFLKRLYEVSQKNEDSLNNYSTAIYITIVRQGRNFKLKYLKDYFSTKILNRIHDKYIDNAIEELQNITTNIVSMLSVYSPKILSVRKDFDGNEFSELIETLYFLVNFKDKDIPLCPVDASKLVNDSLYLFENGILAMQNNTTHDLTLAMAFSLKEVPRINMSNVSDIMNNTRAEMIVTEYISYVDQKKATSQFLEQKSFLQGLEDKNFQDTVGLSFLNGGDDIQYSQSSLSLIVLAKDVSELQVFITDAINMFSKHGIVMAREDVSLERTYYASMPANFNCVHRLTIHNARENGCFCYSYTPQESDTKDFLQENILFNIGTLKSNPVPIGLDSEKHNVMIGGLPNSGKTTMANFLASSLIREFNANICIIEFTNRSRVFIDALGGQWCRVSAVKQNHTALFNALNLNLFKRTQGVDAYLYELFSMLLTANNVLITPQVSGEIKQVVEYIKDYAKSHKKIALHDIRKAFKDKSFEQDIQCWHSIGKYYHLFDNRDDVFDNEKLLAFFIDETIVSNSAVLALVINHFFTNIIQRAKRSNKPTVVILDEPFLAFGNNVFKNKLNKMIENMAKNNVYCIFKASVLDKESATIVDFTQLVNSCGLQIHFANKYVDFNYGRVFRLEKMEYMAIRTLAGYEGRNLIVKQRSGLYSCTFDLSEFPKMLGILSDKGETQAKVFQIKEGLQTDSFERWLPAYFGTFTSNEAVADRYKLQQELKAIQDIKRLMES